MGVFTRPDSRFYYLYLEPTKKRVKTSILVRGLTKMHTRENRRLAQEAYHQRMTDLARARHFGITSRTPKADLPRLDATGWTYIYFVSDGEQIKIGRAVNVLNRIRAMQSGHPRKLTVLATFMGHIATERLVQRRFRHLRAKGEWFRQEPSLLSFIERIAAGADPLPELLNDLAA